MNPSLRVLINTVAQYVRTAINILLSLYVVRVVLHTLGANDYGIYTLIAGVVAMLSFLTNSLTASTQRYVSYYQGKNDIKTVTDIFNTSNIIHIAFGIIVVLIMEVIYPVLFDSFFNIPHERIFAAKYIYQLVIIMLFLSFITSPYKALIISHENIVYISIIEILDGVLKVILVSIMTVSNCDKLIFYGYVMLLIQLFNFLSLALFSHIKYPECVLPKFRIVKKKFILEILSFTTWNAYGTCCQIVQKEGLAVVLNKVMGTAINAAYGIGFQVAGYTGTLAYAVTNAIRPQIVKAEGSGDRSRALWLSNMNSKCVFFLMSLLCIPCIFEIESILTIWLGTVPQHTSQFCIMVMLATMVDSFTVGLTTINSAIGNIKKYTIVMNTPKLLVLPISYILIKNEIPIYSIIIVFVVVELIMAFIRIPLISKETNLDIPAYYKTVILREIAPAIINVAICIICTLLFHFKYRFIVTFIISILSYCITIYFLGLTPDEKNILKNIMNNMLKNRL